MDAEKLAEDVRMCAACSKMCRHVCPTFFAWRSDSPTPHGRALLIHQEITGAREIDARGIEVLYQCLECSHCLTWCKPEIDIATIVEERRREIVAAEQRPDGLLKMAEAIRKDKNPFGEPHAQRSNWIQRTESKNPPLLYFTGCTAAYREKDIAESSVAILQSLGYSVMVSPDEVCCGSPLFRTGDDTTGRECAEANADVLNSLEAKEIIVTCPGCFRALTDDYSRLGVELNKPVRHISQLLTEHLDDLPSLSDAGPVTYHDPCHLGRHSQIFDEPRRVIERMAGREISEMERNRENASCCGNGAGLRTLFPEQAKIIGSERIAHALLTGARYLITACPFCKNMLSSQAPDELRVLDLPELFLECEKSSDTKSD